MLSPLNEKTFLFLNEKTWVLGLTKRESLKKLVELKDEFIDGVKEELMNGQQNKAE